MTGKRRSSDERLAILVAKKLQVENLIRQAQARAKEAEHKERTRRRAVLGRVLEPYLDAQGDAGDALRLLLAKIQITSSERSVLGAP